eukprot:4803251-Amphidinium_carterae.1
MSQLTINSASAGHNSVLQSHYFTDASCVSHSGFPSVVQSISATKALGESCRPMQISIGAAFSLHARFASLRHAPFSHPQVVILHTMEAKQCCTNHLPFNPAWRQQSATIHSSKLV